MTFVFEWLGDRQPSEGGTFCNWRNRAADRQVIGDLAKIGRPGLYRITLVGGFAPRFSDGREPLELRVRLGTVSELGKSVETYEII